MGWAAVVHGLNDTGLVIQARLSLDLLRLRVIYPPEREPDGAGAPGAAPCGVVEFCVSLLKLGRTARPWGPSRTQAGHGSAQGRAKASYKSRCILSLGGKLAAIFKSQRRLQWFRQYSPVNESIISTAEQCTNREISFVPLLSLYLLIYGNG